MMTVEQGFGMLLMGIIVLTIAGTIMFLVINGIEANKIKKEQERKQREKIDGLN
jgi:large-conductance mechanosensitive channel|tara:strand:+ start:212 stop:373 length:162 start_codon:yes stop_codon:yes gene_type:complete